MPTDDAEQQQQNEVIDDEEDNDEKEAEKLMQQAPPSPPPSSSSSESSSDSDSDSDSSSGPEEEGGENGGKKGYVWSDNEEDEEDNSEETNIRRFTRALYSRRNRKRAVAEEKGYKHYEDLFDFPPDPEKWREEDLPELWADAPLDFTKPGWDPVWADDKDWDVMRKEVSEGRDPPIAPFYLPYRKYYPVIPDNHYDISNPKSVIEELDRIEEFMKWVSYIFEDGSSYEGTVWDDLAHGKGVYVAEDGLVRYEGEWLQNQMEGHGVVEVEIPGVEPVPGSKLEAKMRAEGRIISRDFMSPEDKRWLEMDIEDTVLLAGGNREIPFYEREEWVQVFGHKPEKGRYRYAGQWKHGRMHGCGVYEVNEQMIYGRFYFGELLEDSTDCDADISALHSGIAEVAAAKARMFINKPDGMVREYEGPYGDPQHPYFYEEDDVWMAPGFINQFYEVPDYWKVYVEEVDKEREMWLNSFYKAPLRLPMPAELEHWWSKRGDDDDPEFVLINKEPEPDPEDPSKLIYTEDPLILHTRTGRIINYVEDEEHGVRLFWQPQLKEGEDVDPEKAEFLPLGFDEFYGTAAPIEEKGRLATLMTSIENALNPYLEKIQKWAEEKKNIREMKLKLIESELEFIEAEIGLEEALEEEQMLLKMKQKEEEEKAAADEDKDKEDSMSVGEDKGASDEATNAGDEEEEEEDDEDEDDGAPMSFGTVSEEKASSRNIDSKESRRGKPPFSSLSLCLPSSGLFSMVLPKLQGMFPSSRRKCCFGIENKSYANCELGGSDERLHLVHFPHKISQRAILRASQKPQLHHKANNCCSQINSLAKILSASSTCQVQKMCKRLQFSDGPNNLSVLSLHVPVSAKITS